MYTFTLFTGESEIRFSNKARLCTKHKTFERRLEGIEKHFFPLKIEVIVFRFTFHLNEPWNIYTTISNILNFHKWNELSSTTSTKNSFFTIFMWFVRLLFLHSLKLSVRTLYPGIYWLFNMIPYCLFDVCRKREQRMLLAFTSSSSFIFEKIVERKKIFSCFENRVTSNISWHIYEKNSITNTWDTRQKFFILSTHFHSHRIWGGRGP